MPENVCVSADLDATAGHLDAAGSEADGLDPEVEPDVPTGSPPRLDLTGEVDLGEFRVVNDDDIDLDDLGHRRRGHEDQLDRDSELEARMDAACAVPAADPPASGGAAEKAGGTSGAQEGK